MGGGNSADKKSKSKPNPLLIVSVPVEPATTPLPLVVVNEFVGCVEDGGCGVAPEIPLSLPIDALLRRDAILSDSVALELVVEGLDLFNLGSTTGRI